MDNVKSIIDNGKLRFEDEYLNDKKNGKGKEYKPNCELVYDGEYLNDERNGKGKLYNYFYSKLKYEGEFLNGKKH